MAFWSRAREPRRPTISPTFGGGPIGPNTIWPTVHAFAEGLGIGWSPYLAERVGTVSRCLQLNSQQIATMPLTIRGNVDDPPWLSNPDPEVYNTLGDAIFAMIWSRYARGETFLYATSRLATGYPATFLVLDPVTMRVELDASGAPVYWSNNYPLNPADVLHIKRDPRAGELRGTSALAAYWSNLASALNAEEFAGNVFSRSGVPGAVLRWSGKLTAEQARGLQDSWVAAVSNRSGAPAVLSEGLDYGVLSFSPKDLMLLELREFDAKQLAAAFGVPAFLLNLPQASGLNYSNPAMLFDLWWRAELMPTATQIEQALSTWLPRGNWCVFDPSVILRPDLAAMATTYIALLGAGIVTVDEARAAVLDLPPLPADETPRTTGQPSTGEPQIPNVNEGQFVPPPLEVVQ